MQHFETDFDNPDFVDEMMAAIESDYGRSIARVARMKQISEYRFLVSIIFTDFRLLEAQVNICEVYGLPTIKIEGNYF